MQLIDPHNQIQKESGLVQSGQSIFCRFCYLYKIDDDTYEIQTPFVKCKDYFNEILYKEFNPIAEIPKIYGMTFDHIDADKADESWRYMALNIELGVEEYEERINKLNTAYPAFQPTTVVCIDPESPPLYNKSKKNVIIIQFDKKWMQNTILLSYFTWLLRMLCKNSLEGKSMFDFVSISINKDFATRLKGLIDSPEKFLEFQGIDVIPKEYSAYMKEGNVEFIHSSSGWYNLNQWVQCDRDSKAVTLLKELNACAA